VLFVAAAPLPFGFDAATFLVAALLALRLRADLGVPADQVAARRALRAEIAEGLRWLWSHRELRLICVLLTLWNLVESALLAILVLYALEVLRLPEASYGLLLAGLAVGGVVGSLLAERVGRAAGTGRSLAGAVWLTVLAYAGTGLTSNGVVAFLMLALAGAAAFVWNVLVVSFRQAITPARLLGRVNSAFRFASWGVISIGAALGGLAAELLGLRAPFLLAAGLLALLGAVVLPRLGNERLARARAAAQAG
jgi:Na+/melibiose symporter-like transporter